MLKRSTAQLVRTSLTNYDSVREGKNTAVLFVTASVLYTLFAMEHAPLGKLCPDCYSRALRPSRLLLVKTDPFDAASGLIGCQAAFRGQITIS